MIALEDLHFARGDFAMQLAMSVPRGRRLAVIGPSGAGKSTLLQLIAGFETPGAGRVCLDGVDVTAQPVAARPLSILFQDGNLFPHLGVWENVGLGLDPGLRLDSAAQARVEAALAQVGLAGMGARKPASLSGGQMARVALARMLVRDRPVVLMDEPFSALDPGLRAEMAGLVCDLCEAHDLTLVFVAHDLRGLGRLATDLCLIDSGRIVVEGEAAALLADPPDALRPWL